MKVWRTDPSTNAFRDEAGFAEACDLLAAGKLVAVPTETVYGLAADATNADAVAGIFAAKDRPRFNPLISHLESVEAAMAVGDFGDMAKQLADAFWPGALTLVVGKHSDAAICDLVTAGLDTVALRVPDAPVMRALAEALERPLAAPSANRSGRVSATSADDVAAELGDRVSMVIDTGPCAIGIESTIVDVSGEEPRLLRPGGIARDEIEDVLDRRLAAPTPSAKPIAPGMLTSHYAPRARMRLNAVAINPGEALLAFGDAKIKDLEAAVAIDNLSASGNLREAAANLFRAMRHLDESGAETIAVMPIPNEGLGEAILDRLSRAAAPRDR